jgi:hypothetical protein
VYFYNGYVYHNDKYYNYHVRCVRRGPSNKRSDSSHKG